MSYQFNDESKEVKEFGNYFTFGVHKVQIGYVELSETESGKEFVEVSVIGQGGEEDSARVWFTTDKAANYSFNVLRQIYVHNFPDAEKDAAKAKIDAVLDTKALVDLMAEVVGKECWFTKYQSPDRTYQAADGSTKPSVDKNIMGYEPKTRTELIPKNQRDLAVDDFLADAGPATGDAAANIPDNWAQ